PEALEVTRQIEDEFSRSIALSALAEHLPELRPEALEVTRQIEDESSRSSALSALAEHLPEALLPKALNVIWDIHDKYYCAIALQSFLPHLEQLAMAFRQWVSVLEILAYQNRTQLLSALPQSKLTLVRLGSEQAFSDTLQVVRDVCQQWP
ncbi:MAG: hypothetical protein AAGG53_17890, partial [Cyanobacteria bacterium P01_H01_bin.152]